MMIFIIINVKPRIVLDGWTGSSGWFPGPMLGAEQNGQAGFTSDREPPGELTGKIGATTFNND